MMATLCDCTALPQISDHCICRSGSDAIRALTAIRFELAGTYTAAGIRVWMHAANRNLDGRSPMALVMAGHADEAIAEAHRVGAA